VIAHKGGRVRQVTGGNNLCRRPGDKDTAHTVSKGKLVNIPAPGSGTFKSLLLRAFSVGHGPSRGQGLWGGRVGGVNTRRQRKANLWDANRDSGKRSLFLITDNAGAGVTPSRAKRGPGTRIALR